MQILSIKPRREGWAHIKAVDNCRNGNRSDSPRPCRCKQIKVFPKEAAHFLGRRHKPWLLSSFPAGWRLAVQKSRSSAGEWHCLLQQPSSLLLLCRAAQRAAAALESVCTNSALNRHLTRQGMAGRSTGAGIKESLGANSSNSIKT